MALIALAIIALWPRVAEPIAYRVDGEAESRQVDRPIAASAHRPRSIGFTDGSAVRLSPSARARVRQLRTDGVTLTLDRGEATVSVRHRKGTRWSVEAGPFLVRVTGTRFRVAWQPEHGAFDLQVFEGEVRASGPDMPERILRDGDGVHRTLAPDPSPESPSATERPESVPSIADPLPAPRKRPRPARPKVDASTLQPPEKQATSGSSADDGLASETGPQNQQEQSEALTEAPGAEEPAEPAWKTLLDQHRYAELLTMLGPEQVEQALWQAGPNQLIDLGAAARELADTRAGYIYSVVRSRFPSSDAAADAAFLLGRMEFHSGAYRGSATWFGTYLRERPDGRFAREATGRLLEAYHQSGDEENAREAARQYLGRYPDGPHAALARSVLE